MEGAPFARCSVSSRAFPKEPKQTVEGGEDGQDCEVSQVDLCEAEGADGDAGGDETDGQQRQQDIFLVHETPSLPFFS